LARESGHAAGLKAIQPAVDHALVDPQQAGDGGNRLAVSREQDGVAAPLKVGAGAGPICLRHFRSYLS
jgi:hypothetical protein